MADLTQPSQPEVDSAAEENFLARVDSLLDWTGIRSSALGAERSDATSLPLFALRIALLKDWYGLSDGEARARLLDRLSFRAFVGFAGDGSSHDMAILNELNHRAWANSPAMASARSGVEQQLRQRGYSVRSGVLREASLMPRTESGSERPESGPTELFSPAELGRMVEAVTAKAQAEGWAPGAAPEPHSVAFEMPNFAASHVQASSAEVPRMRAVLEWPWGQRTQLTDHLEIGRDHTFSPLARELTPYTHVSRKHAEFMVFGESVWVRDLGSRNGTYVNGEEVPKGQAVLIDGDAVIRFGPELAVSLRVYD